MDEAVEALMDAHGFALVNMVAGPADATASFSAMAEGKGAPWRLTLAQPTEGAPTITLGKGSGDRPSLSLSVVVDGEEVASLAEGVGLAVSFVAFSEQMRAES